MTSSARRRTNTAGGTCSARPRCCSASPGDSGEGLAEAIRRARGVRWGADDRGRRRRAGRHRRAHPGGATARAGDQRHRCSRRPAGRVRAARPAGVHQGVRDAKWPISQIRRHSRHPWRRLALSSDSRVRPVHVESCVRARHPPVAPLGVAVLTKPTTKGTAHQRRHPQGDSPAGRFRPLAGSG